MATFLDTITRIATELRRSNLTMEIKNAINDAIFEAAATRFYFNEVRGLSFPTVVGTEYYSDQNLVEIDAIWWMNGTVREELRLVNNDEMNILAQGNVISGPLQSFSRYGQNVRLYPIPSAITTVYLEGFGRLTPWPLTGDAETNAWLVDGERYIRALAKSYVLRDVIKDFGESAIQEALAEDRKNDLLNATAQREGTGVIKPTQF